MRIKDIFFSKLRFFWLVLLFLLTTVRNTGYTQITNGTVDPDKQTEKDKKEKDEKETEADSLTGTNFYFSGLYHYAYRNFEDKSPTQTFYDDWEQQTHAFSGGASAGIIMELTDLIHLDIGVSYFGHGENYSFQDSLTDSTYTYKNTYMQVAIPMRLRVVYGQKFQVFGYAGIAPLNIIKIKHESSYKTEEGTAVTRDPEEKTDGFAAFNLMISAGFGVTYNLKHVGFFVAPEYRRHLLNTYSTKVISMDHKMFGYGVNAGLILRF